MLSNLTNFLPRDRVRQMRIEYFLRLLTVFVFGSACVVAIHGLLLLPTYQYVSEEHNALDTLSQELGRIHEASRKEDVTIALVTLEDTAKRIASSSNAAQASAIMSRILSVSREGVTLIGIAVDGGTLSQQRVRLTGEANTRESLRQYHQALSSLQSVTKAELPLSAYAKETDIPFTILLTGSLLP